MKAIRIHETGDPEVMQLEEIETPAPKAGEVLIKVAAAGVNYADLAQRAGAYLTPTRTPMTPGLEIAGTVVALGAQSRRERELRLFATGAMPNTLRLKPAWLYLYHLL